MKLKTLFPHLPRIGTNIRTLFPCLEGRYEEKDIKFSYNQGYVLT